MDNPTDKKRWAKVKVVATIFDEATETTEDKILFDKAIREGVDRVSISQSIEFCRNEDGSIQTDEHNCAVRHSHTFTLTATIQEK